MINSEITILSQKCVYCLSFLKCIVIICYKLISNFCLKTKTGYVYYVIQNTSLNKPEVNDAPQSIARLSYLTNSQETN